MLYAAFSNNIPRNNSFPCLWPKMHWDFIYNIFEYGTRFLFVCTDVHGTHVLFRPAPFHVFRVVVVVRGTWYLVITSPQRSKIRHLHIGSLNTTSKMIPNMCRRRERTVLHQYWRVSSPDYPSKRIHQVFFQLIFFIILPSIRLVSWGFCVLSPLLQLKF